MSHRQQRPWQHHGLCAEADKLQIVGAGFGSLAPGALAAGNIVAGVGPTPTQAAPQFLYDTTTGLLAVDADGTAGGVAVNLVTLVGTPASTAADLAVTDI